MNTQSHKEHTGQFRIKIIVDIQIAVLQQVDVLLQRESVIRVCKPTIHHGFLQIIGVIEPKDCTVTTLSIRYEQYTT